MTADDFRAALTHRPFQPFALHLSGDDTVRVPHPEFAHLLHNDRTVIVEGDGPGYSIIDLELVTRIEMNVPTYSVNP